MYDSEPPPVKVAAVLLFSGACIQTSAMMYVIQWDLAQIERLKCLVSGDAVYI